MTSQIACLTCGAMFEPRRSGGKPQVRCSAECRNRAANDKKPHTKTEHAERCAECGEAIIVRPERGRPRRFCSDECKRRAGNRALRRRRLPIRDPDPDPRNCLKCSGIFTPKRKDQVYCSPRCRINDGQNRRYRGDPLRQGADFSRTCVECGESFTAKKANARWCSAQCRRRFTAREESRRRGPVRPAAQPYTDREIFERDAWTCQICRQPIDPAVSRRSRDGATIDHIIPLSLGGPDAPSNVVAAHMRCNQEKNNSMPVSVLIDHVVASYPDLVRRALES